MYFLLRGDSDKMPFHVMKNENVVIASTHRCLGPWWPQTEEEGELPSCGL